MSEPLYVTLAPEECARLEAVAASAENEPLPAGMRLAAAWYRWAPRAKGAGARWLGRRYAAAEDWSFQLSTASQATERGGRKCVRMMVDPLGLDTYVSIFTQGSWEPWILRPLQAALAEGGVFWDIGANVGFMTLQCASLPNVRVIAFEPQPRLARRVAQSAHVSGLNNVTVIAAALGNERGECFLHMTAHNLHASVSKSEAPDTITCPIYRLDDLMTEQELPAPTVMKVDVEGGELGVFHGAERTISRHGPTLVFEENGSGLEFGYNREQILSWLRERWDYRFFAIGQNDIIAAPRDHSSAYGKYLEIEAA